MKKIILYVILINIIMLDIVSAAFVIRFSPKTKQRKTDNAINSILPNVCEIDIEEGDGTGTGIYIGDDYILTCYHLIETKESKNTLSIRIKFYNDSEWYECETMKSDEKTDLLLLKINERDFLKNHPATFCDVNSITMGMEVYSIGNTLGNGLSVSKGIVSCPYKKIIRNSKEMGVIQTNISIENGDSGGPVFNENGEVIGITSFRLIDSYGNPTYACSYAISVKEIEEFLA